MNTTRLILTDLKRAVFSKRLLFSAMGIAAVMYIAIARLGDGFTGVSVWYLMGLAFGGSGMVSTALCLLPVFAFGLSYASEWEQKADRYWQIRTGVGGYAWSKVIVCFVSGFLTVFLGMALFVLMESLFYPFYTENMNSVPAGNYEFLAANGRIMEAYLLYLAHNGFSGSIMAMCALCFSSILPNTFCAATAPMLLYFAMLRITEQLRLPGWLNPVYWNGGMYYAETVSNSILIKLFTTIALCICFGYLTKRNIERRLMNE